MIIDFILTNNEVTEGIENGYVIGEFIVDNTDSEATHIFSLIDDSDGRFDIIDNQLVVRDTTRIDYETATSHNIEVLVTDNNENELEKSFTIIVLDAILESIIDYIEPLNSKIGTKPEIKIIGRNFAEGGSPVVRIDGEPYPISYYDDNEIRFVMINDLPFGVYNLTVFNGYGL